MFTIHYVYITGPRHGQSASYTYRSFKGYWSAGTSWAAWYRSTQ